MSRILAIDFGGKRCGLAETDDLQMIASKLDAVHTKDLKAFVSKYLTERKCTTLVMGEPKRSNGEHSDIWLEITKFAKNIKKSFPNLEVVFVDERFTSKMAMESMVMAGVPKKKRNVKENVDMVSAVLILQDYLNHRR